MQAASGQAAAASAASGEARNRDRAPAAALVSEKAPDVAAAAVVGYGEPAPVPGRHTDTKTGPAAPTPPVPSLAAPAGSALGHIGPYDLWVALARHGLGQCFKAWDTADGVEVMLTLLDLESDARDREAIVAQLQQSVLAAAALKHPGLARIHDAGVIGQGVYIVYDWLPGRTLGQAQMSGWHPTARVAANLVRDLARALAHARAHGVLHGGLNPATVMLDANDRPTVLGLGYASIAHDSDVPAMDLLVSGAAPYLAPEQLQGGSVDARTDVHALGVLLYELLTARRAYPGETVPEVARSLMAHDPAPPHWLRLDVPERLSAIAMQALQRNPAARYAHVGEVGDALDAWLQQSEEENEDAREAFAVAQQEARPVRRKGYWVSASLLAAATAVVAFTWVERHETAPVGASLRIVEGVAAAAGADGKVTAPVAGAAPSETHAAGVGGRSDATLGHAGAAGLEQAVVVATGSSLAATGIVRTLPAPRSTDDAVPVALPVAAVAVVATGPGANGGVRSETAAAPRLQPSATVQPESTPAVATSKAQQSASKAVARDKARPAVVEARAPAGPVAGQTGTVQLAISPWGYVEVGGKLAGASPPLHKLMLPEGTHTITIRNEDFAPFVTTVQVTADKAATVRHRFAQ